MHEHPGSHAHRVNSSHSEIFCDLQGNLLEIKKAQANDARSGKPKQKINLRNGRCYD